MPAIRAPRPRLMMALRAAHPSVRRPSGWHSNGLDARSSRLPTQARSLRSTPRVHALTPLPRAPPLEARAELGAPAIPAHLGGAVLEPSSFIALWGNSKKRHRTPEGGRSGAASNAGGGRSGSGTECHKRPQPPRHQSRKQPHHRRQLRSRQKRPQQQWHRMPEFGYGDGCTKRQSGPDAAVLRAPSAGELRHHQQHPWP